jgi:hypothetical protein
MFSRQIALTLLIILSTACSHNENSITTETASKSGVEVKIDPFLALFPAIKLPYYAEINRKHLSQLPPQYFNKFQRLDNGNINYIVGKFSIDSLHTIIVLQEESRDYKNEKYIYLYLYFYENELETINSELKILVARNLPVDQGTDGPENNMHSTIEYNSKLITITRKEYLIGDFYKKTLNINRLYCDSEGLWGKMIPGDFTSRYRGQYSSIKVILGGGDFFIEKEEPYPFIDPFSCLSRDHCGCTVQFWTMGSSEGEDNLPIVEEIFIKDCLTIQGYENCGDIDNDGNEELAIYSKKSIMGGDMLCHIKTFKNNKWHDMVESFYTHVDISEDASFTPIRLDTDREGFVIIERMKNTTNGVLKLVESVKKLR